MSKTVYHTSAALERSVQPWLHANTRLLVQVSGDELKYRYDALEPEAFAVELEMRSSEEWADALH